MKKVGKILLVSCLIGGLLTACGGGSGDNVSSSGSTNSSGSSSNTGSSSNSGASNNSGSSNQTITASCSTLDNGKTYLITTSGCIVNTSSNVQTGVCTSATNIKLLTGSGLTKDKVIAGGSSFSSGNGLSINGVSYKCV